jgi:hypothetical protein
MKSLRLLALACLVFACTASAAWACDAQKAAKTTKANSTTTATAVVASVNGQVPVVAADGGCSAHAMSATTASSAGTGAQCTPAMKAACEKSAAVAAAMGCSGAKGASAVTASNSGKASGCGMHGASAAFDHCGAKGAAASTAVAGLRCTEHQNGVAHECSACDDWMQMDKDARAIGARSQVVALKNGAMIVFTADTPAQVKQLQVMVAKRNERMTEVYSGSTDAKLCDDCKQLRGALASGKLNREVVNVERGVMALITSNDHAVVQRIRAMTGQPIAMR